MTESFNTSTKVNIKALHEMSKHKSGSIWWAINHCNFNIYRKLTEEINKCCISIDDLKITMKMIQYSNKTKRKMKNKGLRFSVCLGGQTWESTSAFKCSYKKKGLKEK